VEDIYDATLNRTIELLMELGEGLPEGEFGVLDPQFRIGEEIVKAVKE
jgi:hypothetical protein